MEINVKIPQEKIANLRKIILETMILKKLGFNQLKIKAGLNSKTLTDILYSDSKERINPFYLQKIAYALKSDYKTFYKIVGYLSEDDFHEGEILRKEISELEEKLSKCQEILNKKEDKNLKNEIALQDLTEEEIKEVGKFVEFLKMKR